MAKKDNKLGGIPNKHIHQRASFLYQAATYLDNASQPRKESKESSSEPAQITKNPRIGSSSSRLMISHMRSVTLKSQNRLSTSIKHAICRRCDNLLNEGTTLKTFVENKSRDGKKPWADVLVHECTQCGFVRRFPVGAKRQLRKQIRAVNKLLSSETDNGKFLGAAGP